VPELRPPPAPDYPNRNTIVTQFCAETSYTLATSSVAIQAMTGGASTPRLYDLWGRRTFPAAPPGDVGRDRPNRHETPEESDFNRLESYPQNVISRRDATTYPIGLPLCADGNQTSRARCAGRRPAPTPPVGEGRPQAESLWRATSVGTQVVTPRRRVRRGYTYLR